MQTTDNQYKNSIFHDQSLWVLIIANLITIVIAILEGWDILVLMWIYLFQSLIIGLFNFIRMLEAKFTPINLPYRSTILDETTSFIRIPSFIYAFFFAFHYGFFHLAFIFMLTGLTVTPPPHFAGLIKTDVNFFYIGIAVLFFFFNHLFSYLYNRKRDATDQDASLLMRLPYYRILPMHLTLILGFMLPSIILPFFLILKTIADVQMHVGEHRKLRNSPTHTTY